ncbi:polysaccharide lyase family 7 protein [Corallibacter sp.]|uniref:polysaccharide lyase family 7 protein n=1 Tax=Corallibacter sp. TaxID=2038084 RepID=UPI003A958B78
MNLNRFKIKWVCLSVVVLLMLNCSSNDDSAVPPRIITTENSESDSNNETYASIDFNHWKITLPVDLDDNGRPDEYQPTSLVNYGYQNIESLQGFMYDNVADKSIVFYTYLAGATTGNSSYPRTELREQQTPGNNYNNWTLTEGGTLKGKLKVADISEDNETSRDYHRVIVMQIHGIKSQEDVETYNFESNHAPPLLKMTWIDGHIWAYKKHLVDEDTNGLDLYDDSSSTWTDISHDFGYVGFGEFEIEIIAEEGKLTVTANNETYVFEDSSLEKWPFENYFKAGNYLAATNEEAFSRIKYYTLEVIH